MQNFTKIAAILLIVASCVLAENPNNVEEHALSTRGFSDFNEHYQDLGKRAQERFKQLFLRDVPQVMQLLKRAVSELSKKTDEYKTKIRNFIDSINIPELISNIDYVENFLEKLKVGLTKLSKGIEYLKKRTEKLN